MAAKKLGSREKASKKRTANRSNEITPTAAQKRSVKNPLGAIKNDAKDIELRIDQVLGTLDEVDLRKCLREVSPLGVPDGKTLIATSRSSCSSRAL